MTNSLKTLESRKESSGLTVRADLSDFLYHIVLSNRKDFVVVGGKDLPLVKWSYDTYEKEAESVESSQT